MSGVAEVRARLRDAAGPELVERIDYLDASRAAPRAPTPAGVVRPPSASDAVDADVVIAGGGLWSVLAPVLAAQGLQVVVVERSRAGQAHREWNASGPELDALVSAGLLTREELESLVVARYHHGTCRFGSGPAYAVWGALDHAIDAGGLLAKSRALAERRRVRFVDGHEVVAEGASAFGVRVRVRPTGEGTAESIDLTARVLVDARGASSPYAAADLVCPTVGGVLRGLAVGDGPRDVNPRVGEILATTEGVVQGRQYVWEAFPGRAGETTVYLFTYVDAGDDLSLLALYDRFFAKLGEYKGGDATVVRPTFGYIPGWSRLGPPPRSGHPRIVLVGDAAARHSPLTYCGFGAMLRSLTTASNEVARRAERAPLLRGAARVVDDAPIHSVTGALARLMASGAFEGEELNRLLDASFETLHAMGNDVYAALLRDELSPRDFVTFLRQTARRHPAVWKGVVRALGPWAAARWGVGVARSLWSASA